MNSIKEIYTWSRKYISIPFLLVVAFVVFILFFNEQSMMESFEYDRKIEQQRAEIRILTDSLNYYRQLNALLDADPETMERVVRERHHMRRNNEDLYIFE